VSLHYLVKYWCQKTTASWTLWQSCWKINLPESRRVADGSCILKWNLFINVSFTNLLYQFSILFIIISRRFFLNNFIKSLWNIFLPKKIKHLLRFLYPIIDYGLRRVMRELPGKRRIGPTFGLDNLITKLLKKGMSKHTHGVEYRRLCISLTSDAIGYSD